MVNVLQREEQIRDLRRQIEGLSHQDEEDIIFMETSPRRGYQMLYRMLDGEPVRMKESLARKEIHKFVNGKPKWTTDPTAAPRWVPGNVPCFLHPDSEEAQSGILADLGLAPVCTQGGLRNRQAKRTHGMRKHRDEWAALQEYVQDNERRASTERQQAQLEATLALASKAAGKPTVQRDVADVHDATVACDVEGCDFEAKNAFGLQAHKRNKHGGA